MNEIERQKNTRVTERYRDCILSFLDLDDIKKILRRKSSAGIRILRDFHKLVAARAPKLAAHDEICFWQDSVLLVAYVDATTDAYTGVMSEVKVLKEAIDTILPSHAVCVKGRTFPYKDIQSSQTRPRVIYLSASSLAFSNCFHIENELGRDFRADWYIDTRIIRKVTARKEDHVKLVELLPRNKRRNIHMYHGSFEVPDTRADQNS